MDEQRFYEPWVPEIGQRVRVRLSGECRRPALKGGNADKYTSQKHGHPAEMDGMTAIVVDYRKHPQYVALSRKRKQLVDDHYLVTGHRYMVVLDDQSLFIDGFGIEGDTFAAVELEPLDPSAAADREGRS